jgi:hypothetical protein
MIDAALTPEEIGDLSDVTALEAFCLATAVAVVLAQLEPRSAAMITDIADDMHTKILGQVAGDKD